MARAICSGWSPRARTIHSAIRSAERGPPPGICRSCAIKSRIAAGYSVLLNTAQLKVAQASGLRFGANRSETHVPHSVIEGATAPIAARAAPAGANKTATERPPRRRSRALSGIHCTLRPSAAPDKELRRSKRSRALPPARARLQRQAKAARKLLDGHGD